MGSAKNRIEEANRNTREAIMELVNKSPENLMTEDFICSRQSVWQTTTFTTRSTRTDAIVIYQLNQLCDEGKLDGISPGGEMEVLYGLPAVVERQLRVPLRYLMARKVDREEYMAGDESQKAFYEVKNKVLRHMSNYPARSLTQVIEDLNLGRSDDPAVRKITEEALESLMRLGYVERANDNFHGRLETYVYKDKAEPAPYAMHEYWNLLAGEQQREMQSVRPPYIMEGTPEERDESDAQALQMAAEKNARRDVREAILAELGRVGATNEIDLHRAVWRATGTQKADSMSLAMVREGVNSLIRESKVRISDESANCSHSKIELVPTGSETPYSPPPTPRIPHRKEYISKLDIPALVAWRCTCGAMGHAASEHFAQDHLEAHIEAARFVVEDREELKTMPADVVLRSAGGAIFVSGVNPDARRTLWQTPGETGTLPVSRIELPALILFPRKGRDGMEAY